MTKREENIVNIAMRAAELLKDSKIERSDITGHMGLTEEIIALADRFELDHANVDFDAADRDYWIEIDEFTERELLAQFGKEQATPQRDPVSIYLCPQEDHTYSAAVSLDKPPFSGALKLAVEQDYPVDVLFARTDLNGSTCFESEQCTDLSDLLSALDWCGKCRYTIHCVWDFDIDKTENQDLIQLFNDAYVRRCSLIAEQFDAMLSNEPEPPAPLVDRIQNAQQRMGQAPELQAKPQPHMDHIDIDP